MTVGASRSESALELALRSDVGSSNKVIKVGYCGVGLKMMLLGEAFRVFSRPGDLGAGLELLHTQFWV